MKRRWLPQGGNRRSGDATRPSSQLTERQSRAIIGAAYEAWQRDRPFNRFVTLLWEQGGIDPRDNGRATREWRHHARDFLASHDERLFHCWAQEYGSRYGAHAHMLLHVPPILDPLFRPKPLHWAKLCLPGLYVSGVAQCQRIAASRNPDASPMAYEAAVMSKVHYMLKCAPADLEARLGMVEWRSPWSMSWGRTGWTFGKRAGRWQDRKKVSPSLCLGVQNVEIAK